MIHNVSGQILNAAHPVDAWTGCWVVPLKSVATIKCTTFIAAERKNAIKKAQHKMKKYLTIVKNTFPPSPYSMRCAKQNEEICPSFSRFSRGKWLREGGSTGPSSGIAIGIGIGTVTATQFVLGRLPRHDFNVRCALGGRRAWQAQQLLQ